MVLRNLACAFAAEGRLAEGNKHYGDAAKSDLDLIHFGNEAARGGRMVEGMIGIAIESMGTDGLERIAQKLDAKSSREAATNLELLDSQRQTWQDILDQEKNWVRNVFGLRGALWGFYMDLTSDPAGKKHAKQTFNEKVQRTRQSLIDLATHAYELDKGKPPTSIADLVPTYLKDVPKDPTTGKDMTCPP